MKHKHSLTCNMARNTQKRKKMSNANYRNYSLARK